MNYDHICRSLPCIQANSQFEQFLFPSTVNQASSSYLLSMMLKLLLMSYSFATREKKVSLIRIFSVDFPSSSSERDCWNRCYSLLSTAICTQGKRLVSLLKYHFSLMIHSSVVEMRRAGRRYCSRPRPPHFGNRTCWCSGRLPSSSRFPSTGLPGDDLLEALFIAIRTSTSCCCNVAASNCDGESLDSSLLFT